MANRGFRSVKERRKLPCPVPRQESDEYMCAKCGLRWDVHDDKPSCPNK